MSQILHRQRLRERQGLTDKPTFDPSFIPAVAATTPIPQFEPEDDTPLTMEDNEQHGESPKVTPLAPPANSPGPIATAHPVMQSDFVLPHNPAATIIPVNVQTAVASSPGPSQHPAMHLWPEGEGDGYTLSPDIVAGKR